MLDWLFSNPLALLFAFDITARIILAFRVVYRRTPVPDTLAWLVLLLVVPYASTVLYFLIGENRLGRSRARRFALISREIESHSLLLWRHADQQAALDTPMARLLERLSGLPGVPARSIDLIGDSGEFLSRLIADIDAAKRHVHLLYFIWEPDEKGELLARAVERAAKRGVTCRVLVDDVGSSRLLKSPLAHSMRASGVMLVGALHVNPIRAIFARIDLRNHRKIAVIDNTVGYCGSQNITIENFQKRKGTDEGPWIDASVRLTGPPVLALQATFLSDWGLDGGEDLRLLQPLVEDADVAQPLGVDPAEPDPPMVFMMPSGPGNRPDAIHQSFLSILHSATKQAIITTPYFVPDEATKAALINAAYRGVDVTVVVPLINDGLLVGSASRAHYEELLEAGIKVLQHDAGLLHAKTATVDSSLAVIGSANFDMRSFWLNFEATLFVKGENFCDTLRYLQRKYINESRQIDLETWRARPAWRRFADNAAQLLGPLL